MLKVYALLEELVDRYPHSEYALQSHLKLADIYEVELNEPIKALDHLAAIRLQHPDNELSWEIRFRMAEAYFKLEDFNTASEYFTPISEECTEQHLVERSLLRIGTILQIQKNHSDSIEYFQRVLNETLCEDCRLQAQLSLIESYELVDRIGEAIEIAEQIEGKESESENIQELLLQRLLEKQKHYEPKLWSRR